MNIAIIPVQQFYDINKSFNEQEIIRFWNTVTIWIIKTLVDSKMFDEIFLISDIDIKEYLKLSTHIKTIRNDNYTTVVDNIIFNSCGKKKKDYLTIFNCDFFFNKEFLKTLLGNYKNYDIIYVPNGTIEIGQNHFTSFSHGFITANISWLKSHNVTFSRKVLTCQKKSYYRSLFDLNIKINKQSLEEKIYFEEFEEAALKVCCQLLSKKLEKDRVLDITKTSFNNYMLLDSLLSGCGSRTSLEDFLIDHVVFGYKLKNSICMRNVKDILTLKDSILYDKLMDKIQKDKIDKFLNPHGIQ